MPACRCRCLASCRCPPPGRPIRWPQSRDWRCSPARCAGPGALTSCPDCVRSAEPLGHSPGLWDRLVATGAIEMAVPEDAGGGGATLLDLALVAEQHGRHVAPAPLVEAQVAARLLSRLPAGADTLA